MLFNYLLTAWRTIRRNKLYSLVSIGCLAIGIAVSMTILLYVLHENSYEGWQTNSRRIFAVRGVFKLGEAVFNSERLSAAAGPLVEQADPQVEGYLRACPVNQPVTVSDPLRPGSPYTEKGNFLYADSNFYRFFSFRLHRGQPGMVLQRPFTMVLSERLAKKYFGQADPVGRVLRVNGKYDFEVTGVAADPPSNTDLQYELVVSLSSMRTMPEFAGAFEGQRVQGGLFKTWLLIRDPRMSGRVAQSLAQLSVVKDQPERDRDVYQLTALADAHLNNNFGDTSNQRYLRIFPLVAGLILLLALVNYMSLATARAAARAREVGVRKVMGAGRGKIAGQFYTESAVFGALAFMLGIGLFLLWWRYFLGLLRMRIDAAFLLSPLVLACSGGLLLLVILVAGSYPSLVLSAFRPVAVLYGRFSPQRSGERLRKGFIMLQFAIGMALVVASLIIEKQLYLFRHTDTGVDRENVVMIPFGHSMGNYTAFKRAIESLPGIRMASTSRYPIYKGVDAWTIRPLDRKTTEMVNGMTVDQHFVAMMGLTWVKQPVGEPEMADGSHLVLNEAAVEKLGLGSDPVGKKLRMGNQDVTVAGVVKDFNYQALRTRIGPLYLFISPDTTSGWGKASAGCLLAKTGAHVNLPGLVEDIRKVYARYDRQAAFEYSFADEAFDDLYKAEDRLAGLFGMFTVITIVIACLGLFALATFAAQQRVKEIGIRKVLGASVASIGALLAQDFLRPVLLAVVIACPVAWWAMSKWLEDFAYRTTVSWWIFVLSGLALLMVALGTVLLRSLRAGMANPVDNLRAE